MKKITLLIAIILASYLGFGQGATPTAQVRVATATTAFGINVPVGFTVYDIGADKYYVCKTASASTLTLTTGSANFTQIGGTGMGTDLSLGTITNTVIPLNSSTGTDVNLPAATTTLAGLMTGTDKTKLDGITGSNTGDQTITLTGPVTGSGTGSFATTITDKAITLAKMNDMATASFIGRNTAATGVPEVLSTSTVKTMLNLTGTNSGDQTITLTGDVTGSGTGSFATTIANSSVTLAKQANVATATIMGRTTAGTGVQEALTVSQVKTMLGVGAIPIAQDFEKATADSAAGFAVRLSATPVAGTISVTVNGNAISASKFSIVSISKLFVALPAYTFDKYTVSFTPSN